MAEDFLGISAHYDFGDFEEFIRRICDGLEGLGIETENISKQMSEAFKSADADKLSSTLESLKEELKGVAEGTEEYKTILQQVESLQKAFDTSSFDAMVKGFSTMPNIFQTVRDSIEESIGKTTSLIEVLEQERLELEKGSDEYNALSEQIAASQAQAENYAQALQLIADASSEATSTLQQMVEVQQQVNAAPEPPKEQPKQETPEAPKETLPESVTNPEAVAEFAEQAEWCIAKAEELKQKWLETASAIEEGTSQISSKELSEMFDYYQEVVERAGKAAVGALEEQVIHVNALEETLKALNIEAENAWMNGDEGQAQAILDQTTLVNEELGNAYKRMGELAEQINVVSAAEEECNAQVERFNEALQEVADEEEQQRIDSIREKLQNGAESLKDWATGHGKAQEALKSFKDGLTNLPGPLGGAVGGLKKMVLAAKAFITTPIGIVLGTIVFLLKAFQTWATKSAEGQRVMAKVTAFLGSILESLTDILVKVGSYLFHAFADAQGPMNAFANSLVTTLKYAVSAAAKLLGGLGDTLHGIGKMFSGDISGGWELLTGGLKSVWDAVKDAGHALENGVKTVFNGIKGTYKLVSGGIDKAMSTNGLNTIKDIYHKGFADANASKEQLDAEEKITENRKAQLEYDDKIAAKRKEIAEATKDELRGTVNELRALTSDKYEELVETQQKRLDLIKQENKLHTPTIKSLAQERVAELELLTIENKRAAAFRAIDILEDRQEKKLDRKEKQEKKAEERKEKAAKRQEEREKKREIREAKAAAREAERERRRTDKQKHEEDKALSQYDEVLDKNVRERVQEQVDIEDKISKAKIDAQKDGAEKRAALREYEHKKELSDLDKEAQELIDKEVARQKEEFEKLQAIRKAQGKSYRAWNIKTDIDNEPLEKIKAQYEELGKLQQQIWDVEETKTLVDKYKDYYDQRIEAEEQFNEEINRLRVQRNLAAERGNYEEVDRITRAILQAEKAKGEALVKNAVEQIKANPDNYAAFEDLGKASADAIKKLILEFRKVAAEGEKSGASVKAVNDEIKKLQQQLSVNAPFVAMENATKEAKGALEAVERAKRQLEDIQNGRNVIKSISKDALGNYTIEYKDEAEAQEELRKAQDNYTKATHVAIEASTKAIGVIDDLRKSFENLGKAIGGDVGNIFSFIGSLVGTTANGLKSTMAYVEGYDKAKKALDEISAKHKLLKDAAIASGDANAKTGLESEVAAAKMQAAAQKAQMWIAAMSAMVQIINAVQSILPTSDSLYEKYAKKQQEINNLRRAVDEYKLAVLASQQAERNWFSVSGLTSLTDAYEKHGKVVEAYYAKLYEAQEKYQNKAAGISKVTPYIAAAAAIVGTIVTYGGAAPAAAALLGTFGASLGVAAGAVTAAAVGTIAGAATAAAQAAVAKIRYQNGQVAAKDNLRIQTRHKTWFRGEKTQDLSEWAREQLGAELFDQEGLLNLEAAQKILERYGDKLVGETKETLEDLVKLREQYNEFMEQVEKYVSDLYSPLVDDMTDALFEWLETGTDVLRKFRENARDTFEAIAKDMVKQMLMTQVFDQYKEDLKKIYAAYAATQDRDVLISGVMAATDSFLAKAETELPVIQEALTKINEQFAERGFDLTGSSEEGSGAYKAAQTFSQEQGDELNGRLAAIQIGQQQGVLQRSQLIELQGLTFGAVVLLKDSITATANDISAMRDMQFNSLQRLTEISIFTSVLPAMAENINDMRNDIRTKL